MPPPNSRQSRHLWVGNLPEDVNNGEITDFFSRFGKVEGVHILPQRYVNQGIAAFVDFFDVHSAVDAVQTAKTFGGRDIRVNYKFKDGPGSQGGQRFGRYEQGGGRGRDRYQDRRSHKRSRSRSGSSSSSSSSNSSRSKSGSRGRSRSRSRSKRNSSRSSSSSSSSRERRRSRDRHSRSRSRSRSRSPSSRIGLFVKVSNLSSEVSDDKLRDSLFFEMRRHGEMPTIRIYRDNNDERYAVVKYRNVGDAQNMYSECKNKTFLGEKMKLSPWHPTERRKHYDNYQQYDRQGYAGRNFGGVPSHPHPFGPHSEESLDPNTTRTIFVGNIPRETGVYELKGHFHRFGHILDVEIKKMQGQATYGFVLFSDLMSSISARRFMDGTMIHHNRIKVGYGKGTPSKAIWVDGIDSNLGDGEIKDLFSKYGSVVDYGFDRFRRALVVVYDSIEEAKEAMLDVRGTMMGSTKDRALADFCSREARIAFFEHLDNGDAEAQQSYSGGGGYDNWGPPGRGRGGFRGGGRPYYRGSYRGGRGRGGGGDYDYHQHHYGGDGYGPPDHHRPFRGGGRGRGYHHHEDLDYDDYGEQLRAYSAKKERERDYQQQRKKRQHSSSSERSRKSQSRSRSRSSSASERRSRHDKSKKRNRSASEDRDDGGSKRSKSPKSKDNFNRNGTDKPSDHGQKVARKFEERLDKELEDSYASKKPKDNEDSENETSPKQPLKFKVSQKPKIETSTVLSSDSDTGGIKAVAEVAKAKRQALGRRAAPVKQYDDDFSSADELEQMEVSAKGKQSERKVPEDEDISGGDLSDTEMQDKEIFNSDRDEPRRFSEKKSRVYRSKHSSESDDQHEPAVREPKERKSRMKELPLRYREEEPVSTNTAVSTKRSKRQHQSPPSSPPAAYKRGRHSSPMSKRSGHRGRPSPDRSPSEGSHEPKKRRSSGSQHQSGRSNRWDRSPSRSHSPEKRNTEESWGTGKQRSTKSKQAEAKKKSSSRERKKRRAEPGGPRSPSATPPPPPDMEEAHPQQPTEPPPTHTLRDGSFMPVIKEPPGGSFQAVKQQPYVQPPQQQIVQQPGADTLVELLRKYPVMWQGHFTLKNDTAAVQLHFLCGNMELAKRCLPYPSQERPTPSLRIAQRMRLEVTQIEGVEKKLQVASDYCLLLALPCGRDPLDVHTQTRALKTSFIQYLMQKQAAGIINITGTQETFVLHIFPPCSFSQAHLVRVAPDLLSSASDSGHLMMVIATS